MSGALGLHGERMSKVDTAWLRMDTASNLMMIVGVWVLQPGIDHASVCARVEERLLQYNRFRQRVVEDAAGASWVDDKRFDIQHHVVLEKLPAKHPDGEQAALQDRVAALAMQPLDPRRPLWQFHLVERYDGGSALIARIHHCIADGIALISVMMTMVDGGSAPPPGAKKAARPAPKTGLPTRSSNPWPALTVKALDATGNNVRQVAGHAARPAERPGPVARPGQVGLPGGERRRRTRADARRLPDPAEGQARHRQTRGLVPAAARWRRCAPWARR